MLDWIKEKLIALIAPKYLGSVIRNLLQFVAGYLAAAGVPQAQIDSWSASTEQLIIALALYVVTQGWSFAQKAKHSD